MFDPKDIKVGMLVRNLEGDRLGRVVAREAGVFRIQQPDVAHAERYVVEDADVMRIRGAEIILREGPATVLLEREYEARAAMGPVVRSNAEGWRSSGGLKELGDETLRVGMPVMDVEGRRVGTLTSVGEDRFELRCVDTPELATIHMGDVLNVLAHRVVVRQGRDVLKDRRPDREAEQAPAG